MRARFYLIVVVLCANLGLSASAQDTSATAARLEAEKIVAGLRSFTAPMPGGALTAAEAATEEERWRGIDRLRQLGPEAVEALARSLTDPDASLRRNALIALQAIASGLSTSRRVARVDVRAAAGALTHALTDTDVYVRSWAASVLGYIQPPPHEVVVALISSLQDPAVSVRLSACASLGEIAQRPAAVAEALKRASSDPDVDVRRCVRAKLADPLDSR